MFKFSLFLIGGIFLMSSSFAMAQKNIDIDNVIMPLLRTFQLNTLTKKTHKIVFPAQSQYEYVNCSTIQVSSSTSMVQTSYEMISGNNHTHSVLFSGDHTYPQNRYVTTLLLAANKTVQLTIVKSSGIITLTIHCWGWSKNTALTHQTSIFQNFAANF